MNKKLAVLMLAPMLSFFVIPVATVSAHSVNTSVYVACYSAPWGASSAVVRIDGYKISVYCPQGYGESSYEYYTCIYLGRTTSYTATMVTGINVLKHSGTFGPHSGSVGGEQYADGEYIYAGWSISSGCEV